VLFSAATDPTASFDAVADRKDLPVSSGPTDGRTDAAAVKLALDRALHTAP